MSEHWIAVCPIPGDDAHVRLKQVVANQDGAYRLEPFLDEPVPIAEVDAKIKQVGGGFNGVWDKALPEGPW
jgi:hypothetical protein